jgi:predicted RND superfamily exporter protein
VNDAPSALDRASTFPLRHPRRTLAIAGLLALASVLALSRLDFVTDVTELLPTPSAETLSRAAARFDLGDQAYLLLEADAAGREDDLLRFAEALDERLAARPSVAELRWRPPVDPDAVVDRLIVPYGVLYQDPAELEALLTPEGLSAQLEAQASRLAMLGMGQADAWAERDPLDLHRGLLRRVRTLEGSVATAPGRDEVFSPDGRALLVTVVGGEGAETMSGARRLVADVEEARAAVAAQPWARGITLGGMGGPFLGEESERVIRQDVTRSFGASLLLALLLLAFGLRLPLRWVAVLIVPTLWGTLVGAGLFALLRPSLAVLSLGCSAILIGLGIDFTVHVAAAAFDRSAGSRPMEALRAAVTHTRGALALAAFSSGAAFLAFLTSDQQVLQDMGLLTACGLAACLLGALGLLPVLLLRLRRHQEGSPPPLPPRTLGVVAAAGFARAHPRKVLAGALALSALAVGALWFAPPALETDLRRLQAAGSRPLAVQDRVEELFGASGQPLMVLLEGDDPAAVLAACHRLEPTWAALRAEGSIRSRASAAAVLPPLDAQLAALAVVRRHGPDELRGRFLAALEEVGFEPEAFLATADGLAQAGSLAGPLTLDGLEELGLGPLVERLLRRGADGRGHALVLLYPARELWTRARRDALLGRVRGALSEVRGPNGVEASLGGFALLASESGDLIASDFQRIALWTVLAVLLGLGLRFRHPGRVALVLLPAALGTLWTAGLFSLGGWRLNLMNLGVLPMVLAIGIDDGIHVMHQVLRRSGPMLEALRATAIAVLLTSLTTMVTFGSLAFSRNPGIASVGVLSFLGIGSCLLATIVVLPALLTWLERIRADAPASGDP